MVQPHAFTTPFQVDPRGRLLQAHASGDAAFRCTDLTLYRCTMYRVEHTCREPFDENSKVVTAGGGRLTRMHMKAPTKERAKWTLVSVKGKLKWYICTRKSKKHVEVSHYKGEHCVTCRHSRTQFGLSGTQCHSPISRRMREGHSPKRGRASSVTQDQLQKQRKEQHEEMTKQNMDVTQAHLVYPLVEQDKEHIEEPPLQDGERFEDVGPRLLPEVSGALRVEKKGPWLGFRLQRQWSVG